MNGLSNVAWWLIVTLLIGFAVRLVPDPRRDMNRPRPSQFLAASRSDLPFRDLRPHGRRGRQAARRAHNRSICTTLPVWITSAGIVQVRLGSSTITSDIAPTIGKFAARTILHGPRAPFPPDKHSHVRASMSQTYLAPLVSVTSHRPVERADSRVIRLPYRRGYGGRR